MSQPVRLEMRGNYWQDGCSNDFRDLEMNTTQRKAITQRSQTARQARKPRDEAHLPHRLLLAFRSASNKALPRRFALGWACTIIAAAFAAAPATAQGTYPERPIRLIIPVAAGGGSDTL